MLSVPSSYVILFPFRHSGVKTKIDRLLREFSSNAWAVQLTREAFSEHDVANALKRFVYMEIINR